MTMLVQNQTVSFDESAVSAVRQYCRGAVPLDAKLEPWMLQLIRSKRDLVFQAVADHGSPINVVSTAPFQRNIARLGQVACRHQVDLKIYFARKANKCLSFVDAGAAVDAGMDVASEAECRQVLQRGVAGSDVVCTAAVKTFDLLQLCVGRGVTIVIDNFDELAQTSAVASALGQPAQIAIRLSGFLHEGTKLESRFGFDIDQVPLLLERLSQTEADVLNVAGLHFHLDGYDARQRVSAIGHCLHVVDLFRDHGHPVASLDIGGGFPICYLEQQAQWDHFWRQHDRALLGQIPPITYRNHGLGRLVVDGAVHGRRNSYPFWQSVVRDDWLDQILSSSIEHSGRVAEAIRSRNLQLCCEPGRSLLDGCGLTIARVEFCKRHVSGDYLVGLAMNRTQCRTSSDDFLVDPLMIPKAARTSPTSSRLAVSGYLVGAYCTESELLQLRRLNFPQGIAAGDLVVFPNTAGYLMHFLESRSHQYPLATNLVYDLSESARLQIDLIDRKALV